jgi:hypothetical protein
MSLRKFMQRGAGRIARELRRASGGPFPRPSDRRLIVHCAHHRVGSTWFVRVLSAVADEYGLHFQNCIQADLRRSTDVFLQDHSLVDLPALPPHRGSHMIRDPRDVVVSRYFFHLWTTETWVHVPDPAYGGRTYQEYLNSLDQEAGILAEIDRFVDYGLAHMADWNYKNPNFLELRYETIIGAEEQAFRRLFTHYGFRPDAVERSLEIANRFSFERQTKRKVGEVQAKSHLRSGRPGEWRDVLSERHKARCKELFGQTLITLGYETGSDW